MEVNEVRPIANPPDTQVEEVSTRRAAASARPSDTPTPESIEPDAVSVETQPSNEASNLRSEANKVISVINIASDATTEIDKLVKSIGGIAEQAQADDLTENRRAILESEANSLIDEIKQRAQNAESDGVRPLAGDKIRLEVEEKIGKALEIVFPEGAREAFGIGQVSFSPKEAILATITKIESAERQLSDLRSAVHSANESVRGVVDRVEVVLQNQEASGATLRNVDEALNLAGETRVTIGKDPKAALGSAENLNTRALDLLK